MAERNPWRNIIREITTGNGSTDIGGGALRSNQAPEKAANPERYTVRKIRGIMETEDLTRNTDYIHLASWMSNPEVRRHLKTPIPEIKNTDIIEAYSGIMSEAMSEALRAADRYYHNKNRQDEKSGQYIDDDPNKIIPIVAVNGLDHPVASLVIRLKGDPFANSSEEIKAEGRTQNGIGKGEARKISRVAGIETVVVNPDLKGLHIGTPLMVSALDIMFNRYKGYAGKSATAVRLWVFTDKQAEPVGPNLNFFRSLGFINMAGGDKGGNWIEYAEARGIPNPDNRDGMQFELTRDRWETTLKKDAERKPEDGGPRLVLLPGIIDEASLRIAHDSTQK